MDPFGPKISKEAVIHPCVRLWSEAAESEMGESTKEESSNEEDYMGDLSQFIPPDTHNPTKLSFNKVSAFPFNNYITQFSQHNY